MADSYEKIIRELENFMDQHAPLGIRALSVYSDWYVGITDDADRRLGQHKARGVPHKVMTATSPEVAKQVERYFHHFRCAGCYGGGPNANKVYTYKMKEGTTDP